LALGGLLSAALIVLLVAWRLFLGYVASPSVSAGASSDEVVVVVNAGLSIDDLAELLEQNHLVPKPDWFRLYLTKFRKTPTIRPGEYALRATMSPAEMIARIDSGAVIAYPISVKAGDTAGQVVKRLVQAKLAGDKELLAAVKTATLAHELGVPGDGFEGFFVPDAYLLPRGLPVKELLRRFAERWKTSVPAEALEAAKTAGLSPGELVTLASLLETENVLPSERGLLAAVYRNRLAAGIKLQHRGALAYGLNKPVDKLGPDDMTWKSRYNTFTSIGLPPSPIASPSIANLLAAAKPTKSDALYYADRGDHSHVFCPDEECIRAALAAEGAAPQKPRRMPSAPSEAPKPERTAEP
jgi:UPF0755 protein